MAVVAHVRRNGIEVPYTAALHKKLDLFTFKPPVEQYLIDRHGIPDSEPIPRYKPFSRAGAPIILFPIFTGNMLLQMKSIISRFEVDPPHEPQPLPDYAWEEKQFYDYQHDAVNYIIRENFSPERIRNMTAACVLDLWTGAGKTYIAILLALRLKVRTLYIVHRNNLASQVIKDFRTIIPNVNIGAQPESGHDVVVMVVNSAVNQARSATDYATFGFVIYDEVPRYCTKQFSDIFWMTRCRYNLCMSGTLDRRHDKADIIYHDHLGPTLTAAKMGIESRIHNFKVAIRAYKYINPEKYLTAEKTDNNLRSSMRGVALLNENEERRAFIVERALELWRDGHQFYIFVHKRDSVDYYFDILKQTGDSYTMMSGADSTAEYALSCRDGAIIIATYAYADTGVSFPNLTAMILGEPPYSAYFDQTVGRILRPGPLASRERVIIDIVDWGSMFHKRYTEFRVKFYKERNYTITII